MTKFLDLLARLWALLPERIRKEPALAAGAVVAAAAYLGVHLTDGDVARLTSVLIVLLPLVGAVLTRQGVTAAPNVEAQILHVRSEMQVDQHPGNPFHALIAQPPLTGDQLAALEGQVGEPVAGAPLFTLAEVQDIIGPRNDDGTVNARGRLQDHLDRLNEEG